MATTNIREFTLGVRAFARLVAEERRERTRAVALHALSGVVLGTRVDTSRARSNWQVAEGAPPEGHDPESRDLAGSATISHGTRVILGASGDDIIWLHNGVPYINILEDMDKMVAGTVEALRTRLASA